MLASSDLIAFVTTGDSAKAKAFYRETLGLSLLREDASALVFDAHGTMLRISKVREFAPAASTVLGWRVANIRGAVSELVRKGVAFEHYGAIEQDDLGIWTSPSGAKVAWFKDPDGNTLSLTQFPD